MTLANPVENIGATLIKEAANNTVKEAGDGTTTATVLAHSLLQTSEGDNSREVKEGIKSGVNKVIDYLNNISIEVTDDMLDQVATISCNNDAELGAIIAEAYKKVGRDGVVLMEESITGDTYTEVVDGVQVECGLNSNFLITDKDKGVAELDNPYILITSSPIPNVRKIQTILEFVIKKNRPLLIVGSLEQQPKLLFPN